MTSLLERPLKSVKGKGKAQTSLVEGLPQVNLLPPEVRAARGLQSIKKWLAIAILVVLVVCALLWLWAQSVASAAQGDLERAQQETARLTTEQAKYAEVPRVQQQLAEAERARQIGMATDVVWKTYLDAIAAVLPETASIDTFAVTGATPMTAPELSADPLQAPSVGQISFGVRSVTVPDSAALIDALNSIPGFSDAFVSSVTTESDEVSGVFYGVQASVRFTTDVYSKRFLPQDDAADESAEAATTEEQE
mgnify:CR=1 FL=1